MTGAYASAPISPSASTGTSAFSPRSCDRITEAGDDPTEYVDIGYRVSETKFNAWPEGIKRAFVPARTLKTGKPSFRLALLEE